MRVAGGPHDRVATKSAEGCPAECCTAVSIVHDLRQPLTAVLNYLGAAQILLRSRPDAVGVKASAMVDLAIQQVMRASQIGQKNTTVPGRSAR